MPTGRSAVRLGDLARWIDTGTATLREAPVVGVRREWYLLLVVEFVTGNLLDADAEALVNAVNTPTQAGSRDRGSPTSTRVCATYDACSRSSRSHRSQCRPWDAVWVA